MDYFLLIHKFTKTCNDINDFSNYNLYLPVLFSPFYIVISVRKLQVKSTNKDISYTHTGAAFYFVNHVNEKNVKITYKRKLISY